ncbi:pyridoxamine 5'-phosphate oxidase family protein [Enemella sp. A6]|uniref:pyridoxamine 5'-phosphate oxidase family protein n=1 Tax=Enemella sp. A6 TaxID=3440152 RepID=UPI003EBFDE03
MSQHTDSSSNLSPQRRGQRIAMPPEALNEYLTTQRTCRVASVDKDGHPNVSPLWFLWFDDALWLYSLTRSQRWTNLMRDPRVAIVVDDGEAYTELRGVEIRGTAEAVGPSPRPRDAELPELAGLEQAFADKYSGGQVGHDGRHGWLKITPSKITSWDFTRMGG